MKVDGISNNNQSYNNSTDMHVSASPSTPVESADKESQANAYNGAVAVDNQFTTNANQKNSPSENTVKQAISDINKKINSNTVAEYGYHEDTNRVTIKIVDKQSDKTIREYPAEETLDMIAKVWELAGMFLDEKG